MAESRPALAEPLGRLVDRLDNDWRPVVERWRASAAGRTLIEFVDGRMAAGAAVFPADVFAALRTTPLGETRLVILGQDPYHGAGQAEGLAFSVPTGVPVPPSLRNILGEVARSASTLLPPSAGGHLGAWARAGVLLLNTSLTVELGRPASHARRGWEALTDRLVEAAAHDPRAKVFMLWGAHAQSKARLIADASQRHLVLQSNHPSPLSAARGPVPFIGCDHFRAAEAFLAQTADAAIPPPPPERQRARGTGLAPPSIR